MAIINHFTRRGTRRASGYLMALRSPLPRLCLTVLAALALPLGGCVYRINIQQGNYLEAKEVDQVVVGMTRSQVRFLLGTPMLADSFHPNRWDYLYYYKLGKTQKVERHQLTLFFADEKVEKIERPDGAWENPKVTPMPSI
jgi:outer membrane protein assembly factor BamE